MPDQAHSGCKTIAIVILAAGQSRRFGAANKLVAPFDGMPLIARVVRTMSAVRATGHDLAITVVTQPAPNPIAPALAAAGLTGNVRLVPNPRYADGMGHSVAAGIASLGPGKRAAIIVPGDMPLLSADLVERLIAAFMADGARRPAHPVQPDGTQTNPVIWPRTFFARLMALDGDRGGKSLLDGAQSLTIPLGDALAAADIDTPEDLIHLTPTNAAKP